MNHVIVFDVSLDKGFMVVNNALKKCELEEETEHTRPEFTKLMLLIDNLIDGYGEQPHIVFEATGVYSRALERFLYNSGYRYCRMNLLEAKLQSDKQPINQRLLILRLIDGSKQTAYSHPTHLP